MADQDEPEAKALPVVPGQRQREEEVRRRREADEQARLDRELAEVEAHRMPLMDHLIELRDRIVKAGAALVIGCAIGLYYGREVFDLLKAPYLEGMRQIGNQAPDIIVIGPFEAMTVWFRVSLIAGVTIASPVLSWQVWQFVAPGLYRTERRLVAPLSIASLALFLSGAAFCFYVVLPYAFPFFFTILDVAPFMSADQYTGSVFWMMAAFGACFQMPIVAFFAARLGLVDAKDLTNAFRYAVVVIAVVAALLTPGPDPISQILLAIPMTVLYGISIVVAKVFSTKVRDVAGPPAET